MQQLMSRLVNKAIGHSLQNRIAKFKVKKSWTPDIVISREPGSGGHIVAAKIARKLKWQLFDQALMLELSQELGIGEREVAKVVEHSRSWLSDIFHSIFNPDYVSDVRYINQLKKLLSHAAKKGDLVILGHGANLILPKDQTLRVRITAPFSKRVANTVKFEKKKKEEAVKWVRYVEKKYNDFIRQYFGTNPHNPWNYDLIVNTDIMTLDQARDIIIEAFLTKFPGERKRVKSK